MPKVSERARGLRTLENLWAASILWTALMESDSESDDEGLAMGILSSDSSGDEADMDSCADYGSDDAEEEALSTELLYTCICSHRYLETRDTIPKNLFPLSILERWPEHTFKQKLRMTPAAFHSTLGMISQHSVFSNNSQNAQAPIELQFAVALYRFGRAGNGACRADVAGVFGISAGSVTLFTNRVMVALLSLEKNVVRWPNVDQKLHMKCEIKSEYGFPDVVGIIDGTYIPLAYRPCKQGEDYFCRKQFYALSALIVCDQDGRITYIYSGFPGSAHDSRVFMNSRLWVHSKQFFVDREYLLADTAFPVSSITIPPYKHPQSSHPTNSMFNTCLAAVRVKVEHCIGMLKGRFQSLRGLRVQLRSRSDHMHAVLWIRVCAILHNLLLHDFYDALWTNVADAGDTNGNPLDDSAAHPTTDEAGKEYREFVKARVLQHHFLASHV